MELGRCYKGQHTKVMYVVRLQTRSKISIWRPFVFQSWKQ